MEHEDHSPYGPHIQSIGHALLLHVVVSDSSPTHSLPPLAACLTFDLERDLSPPPQVLEHEDHLLYGPQSQSIGHALVLQVVLSFSSPTHSFPPFVACLTLDLERDLSPPPQVLEHEDHSL